MTALREIRILRGLQHPNIVNLREVVTSKPAEANRFLGDVFMVFDFAEGDMSGLITMPDAIRTHEHVRVYMHQLLKGLAYLHENGVVHRDLKPANLLMTRQHQVKLADFGLAKRWRAGQAMTEKVVTPWYRAPELVLGDSYSGPPLDMWSVGCIFIELMTGQPPTRNDREAELIQDIYAMCGSPTPATWPGVDRLKHFRAFLPKKKYTRQVRNKFSKRYVLDSARAPRRAFICRFQQLTGTFPCPGGLSIFATTKPIT
jgi:cyclin-dependent kinase 12/13